MIFVDTLIQTMTSINVDLSNCDNEPIHIPGKIQSHGFFIAIDKHFRIGFYSENIKEYLPELTGTLLDINIKDLEPLLGKNEPPDFINQLIIFGKTNGFEQTNPFNTDIQGKPFHLIISRSDEYYLLEFEPAVSDGNIDVQKMIGRSISEMLADKNLQNLLSNTAKQIKNVIGFDRVMVYRFAEDGHGEVVAEERNDDLESWIGLHYPASDIPKQARELYKKNLTRLIADVNTIPSKICTTEALADHSLDLTSSQLRAVSPIHIQYLKNMGVASSFSISLLYHKELWGLIACHNYTPKFIDFKARESSRLIGQILSSALEFRQDEENQQKQERFKSSVDSLSRSMLNSNSIEAALTENEVTLLAATEAAGAVLIYEKHRIKLGITPPDSYLDELLTWIHENVSNSLFFTNNLSEVLPGAEKYKELASGMLVSVISRELGEYVVWFKPEQLSTLKWAGDPNKPVNDELSTLQQISPRNSFEVWSQTVSGVSLGWSNEEIQSAGRLNSEIIYAINQKANEIRHLNEKLKLAYEELDTFSFTISHDLKNPLSAVKSFSQILKRDQNIQGESRKMLERIIAGADKMNNMIRDILEYSRIGKSELTLKPIQVGELLEEISKDLKTIYEEHSVEIHIGHTPVINGDALMLMQVFSNLLGNAVKYSLGNGNAVVQVDGSETDTEIVYMIRDNGIGIEAVELPRVFELFKRMSNVRDIEGSGVGLAIVKRIIEKHKGKVWADSNPGMGTTFFLSFRKPDASVSSL